MYICRNEIEGSCFNLERQLFFPGPHQIEEARDVDELEKGPVPGGDEKNERHSAKVRGRAGQTQQR